MGLGPQVLVSDEILKRLSEAVSTALGNPSNIISVHQVDGGANAASHRALTADDGSRFSIKKSIRGVVQGAEKARLVSNLAELLSLPNRCCSVEFGPIDGFPPFDEGSINLIRWLSADAIPIGQGLGVIEKESPAMFLQFGEQALFSLVFGIADRGTQNWVWDPGTGRISIIDEEASFEDTQPGEFSWAFISLANPEECKRFPESYPPARAFNEGLATMSEKLAAKEPEWVEIMMSHDFASGRVGRAKEWARKPLRDLTAAFFGTF